MKVQPSHPHPQLLDRGDRSCSQACRGDADESVLSGFIDGKKGAERGCPRTCRWPHSGPIRVLPGSPGGSLPCSQHHKTACWLPPRSAPGNSRSGVLHAATPGARPRARWRKPTTLSFGGWEQQTRRHFRPGQPESSSPGSEDAGKRYSRSGPGKQIPFGGQSGTINMWNG